MPSVRQRSQRTLASEVDRTAKLVVRARARHRNAARALRETERMLTVGGYAVQSDDLAYCRKVERRLRSLLSAREADHRTAVARFKVVNAR